MEYHFKRQETGTDRVLFALSLDRKSSKERILIGTEIEITRKLRNDPGAEIFYDEIRQSDKELKLEVWYPSKTNIECVTAYGSFLPVFLYYHTRLIDWS